MKPLNHAMASQRRHGGIWEDYIDLHNHYDSSKASFASPGHRALLHHDLGIRLSQLIFGETVVNSDGVSIATATLGAEHLQEDVGFVPTLDQWLDGMPAGWSLRRSVKRPPSIEALAVDPCAAAARIFGGKPEDFVQAVAFFDLHRDFSDHPLAHLFLHNSFGIWLAERALGPAIAVQGPTGQRKLIATRELGELLVQARLHGLIPSPQSIFGNLAILPWMRGAEVANMAKTRRSQLSH